VKQELDAIFKVVGTPSWSCISQLPGRNWRRFLQRLPASPCKLHRRFHACDEKAVDLLVRMLDIDPSNRCTAEEAMAHSYFANLADYERPPQWESAHQHDKDVHPTFAMAALEKELEALQTHADFGRERLLTLLERECEAVQLRQRERRQSEHARALVEDDEAEGLLKDPPKPCPGSRSSNTFCAVAIDKMMDISRMEEYTRGHEADGGAEDVGSPMKRRRGMAERHLQAGRHGDWTTSTAYDLPRESNSNVWGVSYIPVNADPSKLQDYQIACTSQQKR
ncbi:hypothetical protein CYMTET_17001, partial [Cymbomonas tetramitiformis]